MKFFGILFFLCSFGFAQENDSIQYSNLNSEMEVIDSILHSDGFRDYMRNEERLYGIAFYSFFTIPRLEYTYFNGSHFTLGAKVGTFWFTKEELDISTTFIGILGHFGFFDNRLSAIPELDIKHSFPIKSKGFTVLNYIGVGAGISPYYYTPKIYTNLSFINLEFAYNIQFNKPKNFDYEGIRLSIGYDLF